MVWYWPSGTMHPDHGFGQDVEEKEKCTLHFAGHVPQSGIYTCYLSCMICWAYLCVHHNLRTILAKSFEIEFQSRCSYQWSSLQRSSMAVIRYFEREDPLELIKCIIRVKDQLSLIAGGFCPIAFEQCGQLLSDALICHWFLVLLDNVNNHQHFCSLSPLLLLSKATF